MSAQLLNGRARMDLVSLGPVALVAGLLNPGMWSQWHSGRMGELLIMSLLALGIGAALARWSRLHVATVLPLVWLAALAVVLAGLLGWLLQLPLHHPPVYLLACAALVAWRYRPLDPALAAAARRDVST